MSAARGRRDDGDFTIGAVLRFCFAGEHRCKPARRRNLMPAIRSFILGVVALLAYALAALPPGLAAEPARFAIAIQARKVDAAQKTIRTTQGTALELEFTADEPVELHLHGYDKLLAVRPGAAAVMRLDAKTAGRFAIEGHGFGSGAVRSTRHVVLLYLEVLPR
jgi:hypothetical protein